MDRLQDNNPKTNSVAFSGKLGEMIEQKAAELGLTFDEFVKAQMTMQLNN